MMPLNPSSSAIRSCILCLVVYMSLMFVTSHDLPGKPCILKMTFQNFRQILSWKLKNQSTVPTHYTLWYRIVSKQDDMKIIESCTNITTPFCDVTDVWEEAFDTYIVRVERFRGKATLINCTSTIWSTNILYEPPEFEVVGFTNHINVIVKFPPTAPKIYGEEIQRHLSLVIKEQSGEIVKMVWEQEYNLPQNALSFALTRNQNFHNFGAQSFPGLPPSEAVNAVEVISVTKKKKVWDYNYDDESDSDEEVALRSSAGGYTMHGLTGRLLSQVSSVTSQEPEMEDSEAEESDPSEPEPEPQPRLPVVPKPNPCQLGHTSGPYERRESLGCDSSPEDNHSSPGGSGDRITFNVNLNSVFMRVPDDDDSEEAALVSSLPEEIIDLEEDPHKMESSLLVASGERTQLTHPGPFSQCLWTEEDTLSDRSDTSDFDVDSGRDGYIMR
ncbi:interferon alpha/beta receptor 2 isoform X2 [Sciurus carolinensis]|uniref:interferon alpha/beta receptor 2 isoform X2 n=1 Tax=Sciurus carolinensis TaxID=30640 RepID=UPI001FB53160|nr:interferon alpha/beta receptor 2 isoform X2 [Sciurus carolinensis]